MRVGTIEDDMGDWLTIEANRARRRIEMEADSAINFISAEEARKLAAILSAAADYLDDTARVEVGADILIQRDDLLSQRASLVDCLNVAIREAGGGLVEAKEHEDLRPHIHALIDRERRRAVAYAPVKIRAKVTGLEAGPTLCLYDENTLAGAYIQTTEELWEEIRAARADERYDGYWELTLDGLVVVGVERVEDEELSL